MEVEENWRGLRPNAVNPCMDHKQYGVHRAGDSRFFIYAVNIREGYFHDELG